MTSLTTVPTFAFNQESENTITVSYYNGSICLDQRDQTINIEPQMIKALFKEIIKHQPEAQTWLDKKFK